jgi:hypothetical protein
MPNARLPLTGLVVRVIVRRVSAYCQQFRLPTASNVTLNAGPPGKRSACLFPVIVVLLKNWIRPQI